MDISEEDRSPVSLVGRQANRPFEQSGRGRNIPGPVLFGPFEPPLLPE